MLISFLSERDDCIERLQRQGNNRISITSRQSERDTDRQRQTWMAVRTDGRTWRVCEEREIKKHANRGKRRIGQTELKIKKHAAQHVPQRLANVRLWT